MRKLSHNNRARPARRTSLARQAVSPPREPVSLRQALSLRELIGRGARRLVRSRVCFGHGTNNAWDESAALILHALQLTAGGSDGDGTAKRASMRIGPPEARRALELIERRIAERVPAVYLTGRTWFAGLEMRVDPRVLIPRSPIAELIERQFAPWIEPTSVHRVLDLGTGSGCIAIACAKAFRHAGVDASDISEEALAVARINVRNHRLQRRVRLVKSNHFRALAGRRYDIIVSNPPYVGARELAGLPPEYTHEPKLAFAAGADGLRSVRVILREAGKHLRPHGILVVEVGDTERAVRRAFPRRPFTWLQFERGGGGVFLLTAEQLLMREPLSRAARPRAR